MKAPNQEGSLIPRTGRVAVVEDDDAVRLALAYGLRNAGHEVVAAASGGELLARLDGKAPDAVISDYHVGRETGLNVIQSARREFGASLPAIIVTGDTDPHLLRRMAAHGIPIRYKPVNLQALLAWLAEAITAGDFQRATAHTFPPPRRRP